MVLRNTPKKRTSTRKKKKVKETSITPRKIPEPVILDISDDRYNSPIVRQKLKQNPQIYILHKVVTNVLTVLSTRGYTIPDKFSDIKDMTPNDFIISYHRKVNEYNNENPGANMTIRKLLGWDYGVDQPLKTIRVIFPETPVESGTTTKSQIDAIVHGLGLILNVSDTMNPAIYQVMIISELSLSSQARTSLEEISTIDFELYTYHEISFLASRHFLVPKYRTLTKNEIGDMIRLGVLISSLKTIAIDDPIVREYGFSIEDVLEITRYNYLYLHPIIVTIEYRVVSVRPMVVKK
uniref:DNA-directed RNA polymerase subunit 5 n=1 Tax=Pithovirus LCPAC202 TaxID=2506592 RepID=A0A481Z901_9VIRU|nr:MAG: DNA-directed RNA polymerase subunit 5 [Pithovirus LCPAC202]